MELVPGLFYIIFHGESDKTTQTLEIYQELKKITTLEFFKYLAFSRDRPLFQKKGGLKKLRKRWVSFLGGSGGKLPFFIVFVH